MANQPSARSGTSLMCHACGTETTPQGHVCTTATRPANVQPVKERRRMRMVVEIDGCLAGDAELLRWLQQILVEMEGELQTGEIIGAYRVEEVMEGGGFNGI